MNLDFLRFSKSLLVCSAVALVGCGVVLVRKRLAHDVTERTVALREITDAGGQ